MTSRLVSVVVVSIGAGAVAALVTASSTASPAASRASAPVTIAIEAPLSGPQASNGRDMLRGVQLAVMQANAHGGVI